MKSIKSIFILTFSLLALVTTLTAQRGPEQHAEKLKTELELNEEQWEQLQPILQDRHEKMKALRDQDFADREERKTAMQAIMTESDEAIAEILSAEQIAKWTELREKQGFKKGLRHRPHLSKEDHKAMKEEMKTYKQQNIEPIMRSERLAFEDELSEDDKAEIDRLRVAMKEKKKEHKAKMKAMRKSGERPSKVDRAAHKEKMQNDSDLKSLKTLEEKYREPMDAVFAKMEPQHKEWKSDMKEIKQKYLKEEDKSKDGESAHRFRKGHKKQFKQMSYGRFLLMDPNDVKQSIKKETQRSIVGKFEVYPNPASTNSTVTYTLESDSHVTLSLRDKEGNIVQIVKNGEFTKGEYQFDVPVNDLKSGIYYFTIEDDRGKVKSKKIVIE